MVLEEGDVGLFLCGAVVHGVPDGRGQNFLHFSLQGIVFLRSSSTFLLFLACVVEFGKGGGDASLSRLEFLHILGDRRLVSVGRSSVRCDGVRVAAAVVGAASCHEISACFPGVMARSAAACVAETAAVVEVALAVVAPAVAYTSIGVAVVVEGASVRGVRSALGTPSVAAGASGVAVVVITTTSVRFCGVSSIWRLCVPAVAVGAAGAGAFVATS